MTWLFVPSEYCPSAPAEAASTTEFIKLWRASAYHVVLSVTSNGTLLQRPFLWPGWHYRNWIRRLSGMTLPRSMLERGVARWISSLRDSRASQSAKQVEAEASKTSAGFGPQSCAAFARYDPPSCSWKTCPDSSNEAQTLSSATWPPSGSMRSGICFPRPRRAPRSVGNAGSVWPTPDASVFKDSQSVEMYEARKRRETAKRYNGNGGGTPSAMAVRLWPTPTAVDSRSSAAAHLSTDSGRHAGVTLTDASRAWPTPTARDGKGAFTGHRNGGRDLPDDASHFRLGQATPKHGHDGSPKAALNPRFVEALMGWPIGSTDCGFLETESCHSKQLSLFSS